MIRVRAKSLSNSEHIVIGRVTGGVPNRSPGKGTPYTSRADARAHLEGLGWEIVEFLP